MALPALQSGVVHSLSNEEILYIFVGKLSKLQSIIFKLIKTKEKRDGEFDFIQFLLVHKDLRYIGIDIVVNDIWDVINTNDCQDKTDDDVWSHSELNFAHFSFFVFRKHLHQTIYENRLLLFGNLFINTPYYNYCIVGPNCGIK